jgi:hypothetical protein
MDNSAPVYNAAYVAGLYEKYPAVKTSLPGYPDQDNLELWVNPFYKSIADVVKHMPLITYEFFTKINAENVPMLKLPRTGVFAGWHPVNGQPSEDKVYQAANKIAKKSNDEIAKGHCEAWILNAFCADAAILSDTYTFNAACEAQNQNVGTEISTERETRKLLQITDVDVWCGTFGSQGSFTDGTITDCFPAFYWKMIKYHDAKTDEVVTECYWMPNSKDQDISELPKCVITNETLVTNLGFDPEKIFGGHI